MHTHINVHKNTIASSLMIYLVIVLLQNFKAGIYKASLPQNADRAGVTYDRNFSKKDPGEA